MMIVAAAIVLFFADVFIAIFLAFSNVNAKFYSIILLIFSGLVLIAVACLVFKVIKKRVVYIPILAGICACCLAIVGFFGYNYYINTIPTVGENEKLFVEYAPYIENSKTVTLVEASKLKFDSDFPKMDGATALYPIYSAFAKAVYPKELIENIAVKNGSSTNISSNEYLSCTKTTGAYRKIVRGEADIIFVAEPSKEQDTSAKEQGVELIYTPIGKEAFVFFVNNKNPINNITIDQIKDIYSGRITKWEQLNVKGFGDIRAFQRPDGSGSQSALLKLMQEDNLIRPLQEDVIAGMGGIIEETADYKNHKNAIGYSFRFYATGMVKNNQIKLLSINGVSPNLQNIENGTYPTSSEFYAVTRNDASDNTIKLLEWIVGEQGQMLLRETGYTPINY